MGYGAGAGGQGQSRSKAGGLVMHRDPRAPSYIPGWVHAYMLGRLAELYGPTTAGRRMGLTYARVRDIIAGRDTLRTHEAEELERLFAAALGDRDPVEGGPDD